MLKRIFYASAATVAMSYAAPAAAATCGGFTVPTDVASQPGWACNTVTPQYDTTNSAQNNWLDPAIVPNPQTGLTNIPAPSYGPGRISPLVVPEFANGVSGSSDPSVHCTSYGRVAGEGGDVSCQETKFRTGVDFSHYGPFDPIRGFCDPTGSHLHEFFGNGTTNSCSTYPSLRHRALSSTAMGTDVNGTAYWFPAIIVANYDGAGHVGVVKMDHAIVYYAGDGTTPTAAANAEKTTLLVPGLRYVFGYNMDDGGTPASIDHGMGAWLQNGSTGVLDLANAANAAAGGSPTRYSVMGGGSNSHPNSVDYVCVGGTADPSVQASSPPASRFLAKPDGSDPYNGTCESVQFDGTLSGNQITITNIDNGVVQLGQAIAELGGDWQNIRIATFVSGTMGGVGTYTLSGCAANNCGSKTLTNTVATHAFYVGMAGPQCWDGTKLWTPGGYKNVVPLISDSKYSSYVCPKNYYHIPSLRLELHFTQYGWADRQRWNLSSDAAARTRLGCNTIVCPPGFTFHTDWFHGWDMVKGALWMRNCLGAEHTIPHQCAVSQISGTEALGGYTQATCSPGALGAGGRCPQVNISSLPRINSTDAGWGKVPTSWLSSIGPHHVHP